jgi:hypothetical protein
MAVSPKRRHDGAQRFYDSHQRSSVMPKFRGIPKIAVNPSGPIPPDTGPVPPGHGGMASGVVPPPADGAPMADPAKEAAQHAPKR